MARGEKTAVENKDEITMRVKNAENKEQRAQWHKKTSTQTKQLWRQFNRVNHDKMDSL